MEIDRRSVQNFDWVFLGIVFVLMAAGVVNLVSATHSGVEGGVSDIVRRQGFAIAVSVGAMLVVLAIDYRHFERLAPFLFAASLALLGATLVIAPITRGAQAWLFQGRFQPSELAKIAMVLALARHFNRNPPGDYTSLRQLGPPLLIVALPVSMILAQKDMGVALLTLFVALTFLPFVRVPLRAWAALAVAASGALAALWAFGLKTYQQQRILDFLYPERDPLSSGYQAMQSRIAVGSGGLFGQGWTEGTQTQLRFLPTQHTDFIFSVLAEEWGFAGSCAVLGLYCAMLLWGLWIARNAKDGFGALLAVGLVGTLFWPAAINVAMVLGLAPVIGVPLPLFSYGGSALLAAGISLGLLLNVSMRRYVF
ncbi:MAG: rod shape-determining protein RodA [Deltaproteobacteria bacterium]|nr:rod shape-determining protein RodA [Deltaproteobacteria bacterium]MBW2417630.1 rod shape-determining protein RodA [Deltaproteobacteria bacterium]